MQNTCTCMHTLSRSASAVVICLCSIACVSLPSLTAFSVRELPDSTLLTPIMHTAGVHCMSVWIVEYLVRTRGWSIWCEQTPEFQNNPPSFCRQTDRQTDRQTHTHRLCMMALCVPVAMDIPFHFSCLAAQLCCGEGEAFFSLQSVALLSLQLHLQTPAR